MILLPASRSVMRILHLLKGHVHGYEVKETPREKKNIDRKKEDSTGSKEIEALCCPKKTEITAIIRHTTTEDHRKSLSVATIIGTACAVQNRRRCP